MGEAQQQVTPEQVPYIKREFVLREHIARTPQGRTVQAVIAFAMFYGTVFLPVWEQVGR